MVIERNDSNPWQPERPPRPEPQPDPPAPTRDPDWDRQAPRWNPPAPDRPDRDRADLPGDTGTWPC